MLAEAEQPDLQEYAFDMTYSWELHHLMNTIAQGKDSVAKATPFSLKICSAFQKMHSA